MLIFILNSDAQGHITKIPSSVISRSGLSVDRLHRPILTKIQDFQTSDTIPSFFVRGPPMPITTSSSDKHFQWWDNNNSPELVQSGWYGFNRFTPRTARHLGQTSNRKARASFLLGESSQVQPSATFTPHSRQPKQYDEESAIHEVLRELRRNIHPLPQREQYVEPRIIMIEEAFGLPPGILVPVVRPPHPNHIPQMAPSNYRRPKKDIRRQASAPTPVTIKVVPLKITSMDIANALKTMSFVPIPLDFLQTDSKNSDENSEISYDDKRSSDDEADLPRPSSHVATPLDKPLGITYAETQRTEPFLTNYRHEN